VEALAVAGGCALSRPRLPGDPRPPAPLWGPEPPGLTHPPRP